MSACRVRWVEIAAVDLDARTSRGTTRRDSHFRAAPRTNTPQLGGRTVAEHRTLAAGQHCGHELAKSRQLAAPDRIHAGMNAMKSADLPAMPYGFGAPAKPE